MRAFHRQVHRAARACIATACACLLGACTVGPDYVRPEMDVPAGYKETAADGSIWKVAQPGDRTSRGKWWEVYGDPLLNAFLEVATSSNQNLQVADSNYRQARALARAARGDYLPTVTVGAAAARFRDSRNAFNAPADVGPATELTLPLDVSWELDIWGRARRAVESSEAGAQAYAADLESLRLSIQAELAMNYFLLRGIDSERQLLERTIVAYTRAYELTRNRHEGGIASDADVAAAETQLKTAQAQAVNLRIQRAQLEHAIAVLLGKAPAELSIPAIGLEGTPPEVPLVVPSELLERRPDIAAAERRVAEANARIGVAEAAFYPSLSLGVTAGFQSRKASNWFDWPSRFWSLGPAAALTVFDGERRRAISEQARAAHEGTVAAYRQTVLTAFQDVEDNVAELAILAEEARVRDEAVRAAQRSLTQTMNRYEAGAVSYLDVVVAQTAMLENERAAVDVARRRMVASVRLIKALGGGWSVDQLPPAQGNAGASQAADQGR